MGIINLNTTNTKEDKIIAIIIINHKKDIPLKTNKIITMVIIREININIQIRIKI